MRKAVASLLTLIVSLAGGFPEEVAFPSCVAAANCSNADADPPSVLEEVEFLQTLAQFEPKQHKATNRTVAASSNYPHQAEHSRSRDATVGETNRASQAPHWTPGHAEPLYPHRAFAEVATSVFVQWRTRLYQMLWPCVFILCIYLFFLRPAHVAEMRGATRQPAKLPANGSLLTAAKAPKSNDDATTAWEPEFHGSAPSPKMPFDLGAKPMLDDDDDDGDDDDDSDDDGDDDDDDGGGDATGEPCTFQRGESMLWSEAASLRVGSELDDLVMLEPVTVLDPDAVHSVNIAVDALNNGTIRCTEDLCLVFSASRIGWYILYKDGQRDLAAAACRRYAKQVAIVPPVDTTPTAVVRSTSDFCEPAPQPELAARAAVRISGVSCQITELLGSGSFGSVWAAEVLDGSRDEVAVKEINCRSFKAFEKAKYEASLLDKLKQGRILDAGDRIPALIASETEQLGPEHWRVRLVMTKMPGQSVDQFLEWWQRQRIPTAQTAGLSKCRRFLEACHFATQLISDIAPMLERVSAHAYHRDVNSHNILAEFDDTLVPRYFLIDFGLAVDLEQWMQASPAPKSWHFENIVGDCRYWPAAAWLQFEYGWTELDKCPALMTEYKTHLDLHALGITALQVWASVGGEGVAEGMPQEIARLRAAWSQYWQDATRYWERVHQCLRNGGDMNALKREYITEDVHNVIGQRLVAVRAAIQDAFVACTRAAETVAQVGTTRVDAGTAALANQRPFLAALLELVSARGETGIGDGNPGGPPRLSESRCIDGWRAVRARLNSTPGVTRLAGRS